MPNTETCKLPCKILCTKPCRNKLTYFLGKSGHIPIDKSLSSHILQVTVIVINIFTIFHRNVSLLNISHKSLYPMSV